MLKVTLGTLTTIFGIVALIVIFYWRDIGFEPSSKDLMIFFVALPVLLTICILSPLYIMKWLEFRKAKTEKENQKIEENGVDDLAHQNIEPMCIQLKLYSNYCLNAFGEGQEIKSAIQTFSGPDLDEKLTNLYGLPLVSYRIKDLDVSQIDQEDNHSELQLRLMTLIKGQFEHYHLEIQTLIEHIKKSTLFYDQQLAYEYKIHPAWINTDVQDIGTDVLMDVPEQVSKLSYFNIHIILADSFVHSFDEKMSTSLIEEELFNLGLIKQQVRIYFHYWDQGTSYKNWVNLLKTIAEIDDEITCCIAIDSEINQDIINEKSAIRENYIPAEFASSCLISSTDLEVENLFAEKSIYIIENENNLTNSLKTLKLEESLQYANDQPFVIILDSIDGAKISKQINQFFLNSPIEPQHLLLVRQSLGHTQTLVNIWGTMLGMQISEQEFNLVYTTKYKQIQVFILSNELNSTLEIS
ncbi:hypothetical protein B9T31_07725 [Acinetobacter sp. ANC 4558]|uniref:hypothetical protein n=1 Tax=Acinetobacter sp. ANC 4558 TaxID=1977876 RepID=UPI000A3451B4|nr:hypothetical protein [Acinetobacter sp. ANC 4558]OTG86380.1 hypothetical protein B9T31_07725 [Acinetobacter sp. ANC 4558]